MGLSHSCAPCLQLNTLQPHTHLTSFPRMASRWSHWHLKCCSKNPSRWRNRRRTLSQPAQSPSGAPLPEVLGRQCAAALTVSTQSRWGRALKTAGGSTCTTATSLAVAKPMPRPPILRLTYDGTAGTVRLSATGSSVARGSHDLMNCSATYRRTLALRSLAVPCALGCLCVMIT